MHRPRCKRPPIYPTTGLTKQPRRSPQTQTTPHTPTVGSPGRLQGAVPNANVAISSLLDSNAPPNGRPQMQVTANSLQLAQQGSPESRSKCKRQATSPTDPNAPQEVDPKCKRPPTPPISRPQGSIRPQDQKTAHMPHPSGLDLDRPKYKCRHNWTPMILQGDR